MRTLRKFTMAGRIVASGFFEPLQPDFFIAIPIYGQWGDDDQGVWLCAI